MSMRDQYENLDKYATYDYKDVLNAYGHGEDDTVDKVLEIINAEHDSVTNTMNIDKEYVSVYTVINEIRAAVEALRGEQE